MTPAPGLIPRDFKPALLLWAQEVALFAVLFAGLTLFLATARGDSAFAWDWEAAFFPRALASPATAAALGLFVLLPCLAFCAGRLVLLGGTFAALASGWTGLDDFIRDGRRAFWRFLLLACIYGVPAALLWGGAAAAFQGLDGLVDDSRWPGWSLCLRAMALFLVLTPLAFLHAAARFRTLSAGRLRLAFRLRRRPLLAFYAWSAPALALTAVMAWTAWKLSQGTTGWGVIPWALAFEAAALGRLAFQLAAFRCARSPEASATAPGPRIQPGAEADPPKMMPEEEAPIDSSQVIRT